MLRLKQAQIQQNLREEHKRLSMVDFRLRMIDAENKFPLYLESLPPLEQGAERTDF